LTPRARRLARWITALGIGLLAVFVLLAPLYGRMTPRAMALIMFGHGIQERHVFPAADMPPLVSSATEAGETWDQYLYSGGVAIYRSEKFDVTVVARFPADGSRPTCRVFPATLPVSQCNAL
jgi:hypothetical protein